MSAVNVRMTLLNESGDRRLVWMAVGADGRSLGTASLRVPAEGVADLEVRVHPAERGAGVGTRLLDAAVSAAAKRDVPGVLTEAGDEGGFFLARGFRRVLSLSYTRRDLAEALPEPEEVPGYRLVAWEGTVPDEFAEAFVPARHAMDD